MVKEVKKEATGERPSPFSLWHRETLGPKFAMTDIDWFITSIDNKNPRSRYMIIEEKTCKSNSELLLIGMGQFRSLKEFVEDVTKYNIPIFVLFITEKGILNGVHVYRFNPDDEKNRSLWKQIDSNWYINVKSKSKFLSEKQLVQLIRETTSE